MRGRTSGRLGLPDASLERTSCHDFHQLCCWAGWALAGGLGARWASASIPKALVGPQGLRRSEGGQGGPLARPGRARLASASFPDCWPWQ